ncbi:hypothetical protein LG326_16910 (plasmid) [Metaplanococcus flavidus]
MTVEAHTTSTQIDRTTRLAVTITIFGALFIVLKSSIGVWYNIFTTLAYTENFFNYDYMLSIIFVSIPLVSAFSIIRYLFWELQTYIPSNSDAEQTGSILKADKAFERIFRDAKNFAGLLFIFLYFLIIREIFLRGVVSGFVIGIILAVGFLILRHFAYKRFDRVKRVVDEVNRLSSTNTIISLLILTFYALVITFIFGLTFTLSSLASTNQQAKVEVLETEEIQLNIELQNYLEPLVAIKITNYDNQEDSQTIPLENNEKLEFYSEAVIKTEMINENDFNYLLDNIDNEIDRYDITKKKSFTKYQKNLNEYIDEGKYVVEVVMFSRANSLVNVTKFMTTIEKRGNQVTVSEKVFETN